MYPKTNKEPDAGGERNLRGPLPWIALVLLIPSLFTLGKMACEVYVGDRVYSRLHVEGEYFDLNPHWKGHSIRLEDDVSSSDASARVLMPWGHIERPGRVRLFVDGKDYSLPYDLAIRPESKGINRYHAWIFIGRLTDNQRAVEEFVIVQRFFEKGEDHYRVLRIPEHGNAEEEVFAHSERTDPVERTFFVRLVYPSDIGFYSDVLQVWPSIFYPVLYPVGTGLVGLLMLIVSLWRRFRGRKSSLRLQATHPALPVADFPQPSEVKRTKTKRVVAVAIAAAILSLPLILYSGWMLGNVFIWNSGRNEKVIIPQDYRGFAAVVYSRPDAAPLKVEHGWSMLEIPPNGVLFTSSEFDTGWKKIEFFERRGAELVPMLGPSSSSLTQDVSTKERIFTGGQTCSIGKNVIAVVYFVGDARDRSKLDWKSTNNWLHQVTGAQ